LRIVPRALATRFTLPRRVVRETANVSPDASVFVIRLLARDISKPAEPIVTKSFRKMANWLQ